MDFFSVDSLNEIVDSKYSLCISLAKRARELGFYISAKRNMERVNIVPPLVEIESEDPLEIAMAEIREGKVSFTRVKDGIK